jgi:hypothetical protein
MQHCVESAKNGLTSEKYIDALIEEPAMKNLIIDGAAGGETKRRHDVTLLLLTLHRGKYRVHFSTGFFQK